MKGDPYRMAPELIDPARTNQLDALFSRWRKPDSPGAALTVVHDGQMVYQNGYGTANLEYGIPITPDTVFHVASLAKQVTAFAILLLADRQALSLDDTVHKHLPYVPDFGHSITIRHLLQHTSGLRDQWELLTLAGWRMDDVITREQILRLVRRQRELNFAPGTAFSYCNTGYTLLAEIVAAVSGQPFREFARANIFEPLSMHRTHFHDDHEEIVPNRAYSYARAPHGFKQCGLNYATVGATSLLTTAADLARWMANFDRPAVGSADLVDQMQTPAVLVGGQEVAYGFGLGLGTHRGHRVAQHIGIDAGYRAFLLRFPDLHVGIAVLANLADIDVRSLATQVAETYLHGRVDWEPQLPVAGPGESPAAQQERLALSDDQLQQYAGTYYSEELDTTYRIAADNGDLVIRHLKWADVRVRPTAPDTFVQSPSWPLTLRFAPDGTGFRLDGVRVRSLWFARVR